MEHNNTNDGFLKIIIAILVLFIVFLLWGGYLLLWGDIKKDIFHTNKNIYTQKEKHKSYIDHKPTIETIEIENNTSLEDKSNYIYLEPISINSDANDSEIEKKTITEKDFPDTEERIKKLRQALINIKKQNYKNFHQDEFKNIKTKLEKLKKRVFQLEKNDQYFKTLLKMQDVTLKELIRKFNNIENNINEVRVDIEKINTDIEMLKKDIQKLKEEDINLNVKINKNEEKINKIDNTVNVFYKEIFKENPFIAKTLIEGQMAIITDGVNKIKVYKNNHYEINKVKYKIMKIDKNCVDIMVVKTKRMDKICK